MDLALTLTTSAAERRALARLAVRRLRVILFIVGATLTGAGLLCFLGSDGEGPPFLGGLLTTLIGISLLISSLALGAQIERRLPAGIHQSRELNTYQGGLVFRGPTWTNDYQWSTFSKATVTKHWIMLGRADGWPGVAVPRSPFTPAQEAALMALLSRHGVKAG